MRVRHGPATAVVSRKGSCPSTREREVAALTVEATAVTAVWLAQATAGPQGAAPGTAEEAVVPHVASGEDGEAGINSLLHKKLHCQI